MFIDELEIHGKAGRGGAGCVSFRREKYVEFGGPNGGNGGHGGNVIIRVRPEFNTLLPLRNQKHYRADRGRNGKGSDMTGANGADRILEVPVGTIVRDKETGTILADLTAVDDRIVVARGGRGGKGNRHFVSATHRTPRFAQPGEEGEEWHILLELKLMADVGLVGFPNAGKSTLIGRLSAARPKVADYPFTTLQPNLGVVPVSDYRSFVMADIPGIIEGASEGAGLGLRFLRHIERTSLLLILIDPADPTRGPRENFAVLTKELTTFSPKLETKPRVVAFTKSDLAREPDQELNALIAELERDCIPHFTISAFTGAGTKAMLTTLFEMICAEKAKQAVLAPEIVGEPELQPVKAVDPLDEL